MKIVVLDGHTVNPGDNPWDALARLGELEVHARTAPGEVVSRARHAAILVTNKTPVTGELLERLPDVRFIAVLATGYDCVDVAAARRRKVPVSNVPEYGTASVAQHTFALFLELAHRTGDHVRAVAAGEWSSSEDFCFWKAPPLELEGLTLGIVGFGRIGRRVARLARAFGMKVIVASRSEPVDDGVSRVELDDLFTVADVVSLHCPATPETRALADRGRLSRMKPTAFFLNTARGALVDEAALAEALNAGRLAGAALDVVSEEPIRPDNPLLTARNCILTPHLAWASLAARRRLMAVTVENVRSFLAGSPRNVVS
ncbi:MAG: D-2-hydroxyacid dehydrogenase [Candidatus Binatia bacterium]